MTTIEPIALFRTETGQRLHIRECPHVLGCALLEATVDDRDTREICTWCQAELDGVGRTYFDDLQPALKHFGAYRDTWALIASRLRDVEHDQIWVPNSLSYVSLGLGGKATAWVGKTYVAYADGRFVELPGYEAGTGGGSPQPERWGDVCERHFIQKSLNGACPDCF